jgi:hypothetical protein
VPPTVAGLVLHGHHGAGYAGGGGVATTVGRSTRAAIGSGASGIALLGADSRGPAGARGVDAARPSV